MPIYDDELTGDKDLDEAIIKLARLGPAGMDYLKGLTFELEAEAFKGLMVELMALPDPTMSFLNENFYDEAINGALCSDILKENFNWSGKSIDNGLANVDVFAAQITLKPKINMLAKLLTGNKGRTVPLEEIIRPGVLVQFQSSGLSNARWARLFHNDVSVLAIENLINQSPLEVDDVLKDMPQEAGLSANDFDLPTNKELVNKLFDTWMPFIKSEKNGYGLVFFLKEPGIIIKIPTFALFNVAAYKVAS
ncbi:MAG: hypothetical protein HON65_07870 [Rhodospirillales bacterium]|nr:hypothetical protein [Rhodospirillales bacterium]